MDSIAVIKLVSLLLYPLGLFFLLIFISKLLKLLGKQAKSQFIGVTAVLLLLVSSIPAISDSLLVSLESVYPQKKVSQYAEHDVILVLGGGLRLPIEPSTAPQFNNATDRYWLASKLYLAGKASKVIIAGGNVFKQQQLLSEAEYASQLLQKWGVPEKAIFIEKNSRNTEQNFTNLKLQFSLNANQKVLLVTSASHMRRAVWHAERAKLAVTAASADILIRKNSRPAIFKYLPSVAALHNTTIAMHEYYGLWFARLKALISSD